MKKEFRNQLHNESVILEPQQCFNNAIIKVEDNKIVYCYDLIVENLMSFYEWDYNSALEWIEYNTIRSLPYMGKYAPIIIEKENK